jgi:predicted ATP-grasp superfamily ATP-dependent carboligase
MDVNLQALKVIRSLGRDGIRVIGVVPKKSRWEHSSRYCEIRECGHAGDNDDNLLDFFVQLAEETGDAPVLIPMQDDNVLFVARNHDELKKHYRFQLPAPDIAEGLVSKSGTHELAAAAGVLQPQTFRVDSGHDAESLVGKITYPALIKPVFSRSWQTAEVQKRVRGKVVVVENDAQLLDSCRGLSRIDNRLVVQEMIPGPDSNLVYYIGYFDENSDPLASFVGVKERVIPVHFGSASFVTSRYDQRVIDLSTQFMKRIRYKGHVGIEYKYDDRDDEYKLIEVNVRFGLWDGLPAICGIDFARINYDYLLGHAVPCSRRFDDGIKWISFERDVRAFVKYRREDGLSFRDWLGSISTGRRDFAVFALDDPLPFVLSIKPFVRDQVWGKLLSTMKSSPHSGH